MDMSKQGDPVDAFALTRRRSAETGEAQRDRRPTRHHLHIFHSFPPTTLFHWRIGNDAIIQLHQLIANFRSDSIYVMLNDFGLGHVVVVGSASLRNDGTNHVQGLL